MANDRARGRKRRKVCSFCVDKVEHIDYKEAAKLRRYLSERGKIGPVAQDLYDTLTGIQWGRVEDPYGWSQVIC